MNKCFNVSSHSGVDKCIEALKNINEYALRVYKVLSESGCKNIDDHNDNVADVLFDRIIIIDELTSIKDSDKYKEVIDLIDNIGKVSRAVGINFIFAFQNTNNIENTILNMCMHRVALRCDLLTSNLLLGNDSASLIKEMYGKAIYRDVMSNCSVEVNVPFICDSDLYEVLDVRVDNENKERGAKI